MILDWRRRVVFHFQSPIKSRTCGDIGSCQRTRGALLPPKFWLQTRRTLKLSLLYVVVNGRDIQGKPGALWVVQLLETNSSRIWPKTGSFRESDSGDNASSLETERRIQIYDHVTFPYQFQVPSIRFSPLLRVPLQVILCKPPFEHVISPIKHNLSSTLVVI